MLLPMPPTSALFLLGESREHPLHVGSLQLFQPPDGATAIDVREMFTQALVADAELGRVAPLFQKRPRRSLTTLGQWGWEVDAQFDLEYHVRYSALPQPGRVLELLALCSRLHSTLLDRHRPMWEMHLVEGLADGRYGVYFKVHHSLVDGVSALRLLSRMLSSDPDERNMPGPWVPREPPPRERAGAPDPLRDTLRAITDTVGLGPALVRTVRGALNEQSGALALDAPRSMFNVGITAARRFAAQSWPIARIRAVGKAAGATVNDVVLAMCSGALRSYLLAEDALPPSSLIAMVPVSLHARTDAGTSADGGGNAVGAAMCRLGTDLDDPADRLSAVHASMNEAKTAMSSMTPAQILALSALAMSPLALWPALRLTESVRPPFNLIISNLPGPRRRQYWNGARLDGLYPLSIPYDGQALNITCTSYSDDIAFGLTGCRRTVPHLQHLLTYLDDELIALESAVGG